MTQEIRCSACAMPMRGDYSLCSSCAGGARTFFQTITSSVTIRSRLSIKSRHGGKGKPFRESTHGPDLNRATGRWFELERVIDRDADRYFERIVDEHGQVVRLVDQPLTDHTGRGAASRPPEAPGSP